MHHVRRPVLRGARGLCALAGMALAACGNGDGLEAGAPPAPEDPPGSYTVSGTVTGVFGPGLVLANNGGDELSIAADGTFTFATRLAPGAAVAVTVAVQPPWRQCTVANGNVRVQSAPVTGVRVTCTGAPARFAYTSDRTDDRVGLHTADEVTGELATFAAPVPAGSIPVALAADPLGRFLYAANRGDGTLSAFTIAASTGHLTPVPGAPVTLGQAPLGVVVDPSGTFAYAVTELDSRVHAFTIDAATGALLPAGAPVTTAAGPQDVQIHPNGRFVYTASSTTSTVAVHRVDPATGALAPVPGSPFPVAAGAGTLRIHPSGRWLYAVRRSSGPVAVHAIDPETGEVGAGTSMAMPRIMGLAFHPTGTQAYVLANDGGGGSVLTRHDVDMATGALVAGAETPAAIGVSASHVMAHPNGRFVYVVSCGAPHVNRFEADPATGVLTERPMLISAGPCLTDLVFSR